MQFLNHTITAINFNDQPLPVVLTDWDQIKRHEPALAELERQALAMHARGDNWWRRSRRLLDQLKHLAGNGADDFAMRSCTVYDIAETAINKAFYREAPSV